MRDLGIAPERIQTVAAGERALPVRGVAGQASDVTADVVFAEHGGDAVGYVFGVGSAGRPLRVYLTGDTLYDPRLVSETTRGADVLCVCINGRMGNMGSEEAARLAGELGATVVVPMHYGVMPHNDADPQVFVAALRALGGPSRPRVLGIGETFVFGR
jgi:L-ascorbate metabolism protein UlaG (beta-lactamase superfamily)